MVTGSGERRVTFTLCTERDEGNMCAESVFPLCRSGKHFPRVKVFFDVDRKSGEKQFR